MSLVHMAVSRNHVELASWLTQKGFTFKNSEADDLFRDIIMGVIQVQNKGSCKAVKELKNQLIKSLFSYGHATLLKAPRSVRRSVHRSVMHE